MLDKILPLADYLKDKKLFPLLRQLLNYVFAASVTSLLFEKFYFKYEILSLSDYKAIIDFFLKGEFFIPFSIFFIVWFTTSWFAYFIFSMANWMISEKWKEKILDFSVEKYKYRIAKHQLRVTNVIQKSRTEKIDKKWYQRLWLEIRQQFTQEDYKNMKKGMDELKETMNGNFVLIFRAFIATTLYFTTIDHFGVILYFAVLLAMVFCTLLFSLGYQFGELFPIAIDKFNYEMSKLEEQDEGKTNGKNE